MTAASFRPEYILPGTRIGSYEIQNQIGQGRGAVVYDAMGPDATHYALKMCRYQASSWMDFDQRFLLYDVQQQLPVSRSFTRTMLVKRFVRGIQCHLQLRFCANVAKIVTHDWHPTPEQGWPYMVQELVPGSLSITEWAKEAVPSLRQLLAIFRDMALACGEMARAGIIHRNLTPANVLMTPDGVAKIIGFHSATHLEAEVLTSPEVSGQPGSVLSWSPELCKAIILQRTKGKDLWFKPTPSGDLHALGCIMYEMLVGAHPFDVGGDGLEQLKIIARWTPRSPSGLNTSIPRDLAQVVMGLLWKNPDERYSDGDYVATVLEDQVGQPDDRLDQPFVALPSKRPRLHLVHQNTPPTSAG